MTTPQPHHIQLIETRLVLTNHTIRTALKELGLTHLDRELIDAQLSIVPCPGCQTWVYELPDGEYCQDCITQAELAD